jgi:MYXO-CTERM domain-containing protein
MDFIERIFGVSPDNGDGSTEVMWIVALLAAIVMVVWAVRRRRRI